MKILALKFSKKYFLLFIIVIICWFSYVKLPLEEDQRIFLAAARLADQKIEAFPFNVYSSWDMKPIGSRVVVYSFYKVADLFTDYNNKENFEFVIKVTYSAVIILLALFFAKSLRSAISNGYKNINFLFLWPITMLAFFTLNSENIFQPEEFSVVIQMLALPFVLSRRKFLNFLAGLPLAMLITIKGISILFSVQLFVFVYLLGEKYRKKLVLSMAGFLVFLAGVLFSIIKYFPNELVELQNTTLYQSSFSGIRYLGLDRVCKFLYVIPFNISSIPIMFVGISTLFLVCIAKFREQRRELVACLLVWVISFLYLFIQGKFFMYHFVAFLFPIFVTTGILLNCKLSIAELKKRYRFFALFWGPLILAVTIYAIMRSVMYYQINPFLSIFFIIIALLLGFSLMKPKDLSYEKLVFLLVGYSLIVWFVYGSLWGRYSKCEIEKINRENNMCNKVSLKYQLHNEKYILYLSDGVFTYYMDSPSFLRYFFPVCLSRAKSVPSIKKEDIFKETMKKALSYDGKYIVSQPNWIHLEVLPELRHKIEKEYELVYEDKIPIPYTRELHVYKRKL